MGFPRQEYWSGSPFSSPGDLPDPGIELRSLALQADSLPSELPGKLTLVIYFIHGISRVWIFEWEGHNSAHKTQKGGVRGSPLKLHSRKTRNLWIGSALWVQPDPSFLQCCSGTNEPRV